MNKRTCLLLTLGVLLVMSMTTVSSAETVWPVVATFDAEGTLGEGTVGAFTTFNVYVIGKDIGDVVGWELAMVPPMGITVSGRLINNGPGVNLGGDDNYIIGLGECYGTGGADYTFITYNMVYLSAPPADDKFCLDIADANGAEQGFPAFVSCLNMVEKMYFGNRDECGGFGNGCAVINPSSPGCINVKTTVPTQETSWGSLKASY